MLGSTNDSKIQKLTTVTWHYIEQGMLFAYLMILAFRSLTRERHLILL